jgi:hypothetical protein
MLVDEQGAALKSVDPEWPMLEVEYAGRRIAVPDILVRSASISRKRSARG